MYKIDLVLLLLLLIFYNILLLYFLVLIRTITASGIPVRRNSWALKSLSKIISFFTLFKANFIDLSSIMIFLLPIRLYMLITITLTFSRRIVTAAIYALYNLYAQFPGANNLLIINYTFVILFTLYKSEYSLGQ